MDLILKNDKYNQLLSEISNNFDQRCNICKEEILVDSFELSCNHKFHSSCLRNSFNCYEEAKCPLCSIKINFKKQVFNKSNENLILFVNENFNISSLKKNISNFDYSYINTI